MPKSNLGMSEAVVQCIFRLVVSVHYFAYSTGFIVYKAAKADFENFFSLFLTFPIIAINVGKF